MLIGGIVSKASGGSFEQGAVTASVVFLYNDLSMAESFKKLWQKLTDGTIKGDVVKATTIGRREMWKQRYTVAKFLIFKDEHTQEVLRKAPLIPKLMLKVGMTSIEWGLTRGISDIDLERGYDLFSGYFSDTIPMSYAGIAGYYLRQYSDAFILPSDYGYDLNNLVPVPTPWNLNEWK